MSKRLISQANLLVFGGLVAILAALGFLTWDRATAARTARYWATHTYEVLGTIGDLRVVIAESEASERGFLLTDDAKYLAPYEATLSRAAILLSDLQRLTADNPDQQARVRQLLPVWQQRAQLFGQTIQLRRDNGLGPAVQLMQTPPEIAAATTVNQLLQAMTQDERHLLNQRVTEAENRSAWANGAIIGGTVITLIALFWAARLLNVAYLRAEASQDEQRRLARRLRAALDSLSQGVGVFGPALKLRHWNECFQELLDVPVAMVRAETPYAAFVDHLATPDAPFLETEEQINQSPRFNGAPVVYERTHTDGRVLEIRRTPTLDGGFVLTVSDLTKRAQSEAVLRESQKMQAIGQLTGGISHDFNNLLTVIQGNLELARIKLDPQSVAIPMIERAQWAAQRGGTLTSHLLAFARKQALAPTPIDLSSNLPNLVPLLRRTLGEHIDLRFVDAAGLWPAMADPAQVESAVLNLALNARDAMPDGGRLTIELANKVLDADYAAAHAEVTPGDYVMIAVSDTGCGMTPEIVARVFEPFFTTKREGRGTGLGLAMVYGFVKQSGGHVKIYSEPGEGTSVKIYLPRAIGVVAAQRTGSPADFPHGTATILLVEDEAGVREIAAAILGNLGYHVLEAADGDEALRAFGAHAATIDLLLTDVVLPGKVRGRELAERITAMRPEVKVLFMSGYTENSIVHHGRLDDGVQLLGKPFKREQLATMVARVLETSAADNVVDLPLRKRE